MRQYGDNERAPLTIKVKSKVKLLLLYSAFTIIQYSRALYNSITPSAEAFFFLPLGVLFFTQRAALQLALLMFLLPSSPRYQFYTLVRCCTYDTGCFQVVTHPGNNLAQPCLTSVIKWEPVYPWWQVVGIHGGSNYA